MKKDVPTRAPAARTHKTKPAPRWSGAVEGMAEGIIYGWAIDREHPDARVLVELCIDGEPLASCHADVARTDLAARFAEAGGNLDVCHGFAADLTHTGSRHGVLTARVGNTEVVLQGSIDLAAPVAPPSSATNHVFTDGGLRLHGWAVDPERPQRTVCVSAYVGNRRVAHAAADRALPTLRGHTEGSHCFLLDLPFDLADGQPHTVRVVDEQGQLLNGSPLTICTFASGPRALLSDREAGLLHDVLDNYERNQPRSVGFGHYAAWSARFDGELPALPSGLRVGILISGSEAGAIGRTLASIDAQEGARAASFLHKGNPTAFAKQLADALAAPVDVLCCVRAGDVLMPNALAHALEGFADPSALVVYADSEHQGRPWFKPAWNPDYAFATDYPFDLLLVRRSANPAALAASANPSEFGWNALSSAMDDADAIVHVPRVLVRTDAPLDAQERAERASACARVLAQREPAAQLEVLANAPSEPHFSARRVLRPLARKERSKKVTLIVPTRDSVELLERCIATIQEHTAWPNLEILIIDNGSVEKKTKAYFKAIARNGVRVLPMPGPFNFAELNNRAVYEAEGEIIGLINNDIEALHDGWLDEIVGQLLRPGVGAVGAKLLWPNGMVQHGGVLLGVGMAAGHFGNLLTDADWGDHGRNQLTQQLSGATAACLFLRKSDYLRVGGMDPIAFPVAFNDVDLCLRLRAAGLAITWTPYAKLLHAESASRGKEDTPQKKARARRELDQLRQRWGAHLQRDPAYHPSLSLDPHTQAFGGLALPPRDRRPRTCQYG
jgi:GT2 family glycosyltransferase